MRNIWKSFCPLLETYTAALGLIDGLQPDPLHKNCATQGCCSQRGSKTTLRVEGQAVLRQAVALVRAQAERLQKQGDAKQVSMLMDMWKFRYAALESLLQLQWHLHTCSGRLVPLPGGALCLDIVRAVHVYNIFLGDDHHRSHTDEEDPPCQPCAWAEDALSRALEALLAKSSQTLLVEFNKTFSHFDPTQWQGVQARINMQRELQYRVYKPFRDTLDIWLAIEVANRVGHRFAAIIANAVSQTVSLSLSSLLNSENFRLTAGPSAEFHDTLDALKTAHRRIIHDPRWQKKYMQSVAYRPSLG